MSSYKNILSGWGSLAVMLLGVSPLLAQIESGSGLIRITDKSSPNHSAPTAFASQARTVSQSCNSQGQCQSGNCQTGHCQSGNCPSCEYSSNHCPNCYGQGHWMMGRHMAGLCYGCTRSPGTGYIPPGRVPVQRQGVGYTQWYPSYWSGMGYGTPLPYNPAVAVPTDTTQLGYYYNQVPTWQPKPNMIPGIPNPDSWHIRRCGNHDGRGNCPANCQHCQTTSGTVLDQGTNLKPVPEFTNQPSHSTEMHDNSSAPMQQPKVEQAPQPMAFFPEIEDAPESSTKLISFPDLDTASDIDADEL